MTNMDKMNLIIATISLAMAIIGIVMANRAIKSSENIAEKSGNFDKGALTVYFGGYKLKKNKTYDIFYGTDKCDSTVLFTNLPIVIHSSGEKSVEDIFTVINYPHLFRMAIDNEYIVHKSFLNKIKREVNESEPYDQVCLSVNSLNPGLATSELDIFNVPKETIFHEDINTTTKDNHNIAVSVKLAYQAKTEVVISAKNINALRFWFNMNFRNTTSIDEIINNIISIHKEKHSKKEPFNEGIIIVLPKPSKDIYDGKFKILRSNMTDTYYCTFDHDFKNLIIIENNRPRIIPIK